MRLEPEEVRAIKECARDAFGENVVVRLFGSRVRDDERGGDIDLHVEVDPLDDQWRARGVFEDRLLRRIEPQKVDLIISERGRTPRGFERIAYRDGVVL
ncbi:nucleotidyltransferase domain-containing protein [Sphingomonas qomolangmaensis]|uniref:Nucleotidyltransferase domain-containing protein n=1 Tax=Sphingomonas qomolangmaensis TaxID=2918765 RepID=A0ABY5L9E6_9SPHN|nr:nucleotidyltransferase domain-containing protein [Sphingomonas qomolangmaensis]UUL82601.1 nucleotidyltransferase domain-containing protein [Sphingomonas qomolangmaensis]